MTHDTSSWLVVVVVSERLQDKRVKGKQLEHIRGDMGIHLKIVLAFH